MILKNNFSDIEYTKRTKQIQQPLRGDYFRDQTAIIHSTAFRRLKHKTQVFFAPENDHVCTRIEHVLHVATIASSICKGLNLRGWALDIELATTIGMGHDLGHAPFGHTGENILNKLLAPEKFCHEIHSYRVVEKLSRNGAGLNLTYAVKDGIINHNGEKFEQFIMPDNILHDLDEIIERKFVPTSLEGCIVRFSDKIAYMGRDVEDAKTAGIIREDELPIIVQEKLGTTNAKIIDVLVNDMIEWSDSNGKIGFSQQIFEVVSELRKFNYQYIYNAPIMLDYNDKGEKIIEIVFDFLLNVIAKYQDDFEKYAKDPLTLIQHFGDFLNNVNERHKLENCSNKRRIADFIAGMTDNYILNAVNQIIFPKPLFRN